MTDLMVEIDQILGTAEMSDLLDNLDFVAIEDDLFRALCRNTRRMGVSSDGYIYTPYKGHRFISLNQCEEIPNAEESVPDVLH